MSSGLNNKLTGQIGEYLVCAELGRRGFIATPFAGNVPHFDVLATDDECRTVPIQVKAFQSGSWPSDARRWLHLELDNTGKQRNLDPVQIQHPDLVYVCVSLAAPGGRDRFFVLTKAQLQEVCIKSYTEFMDKHDWRRPHNPASYDNRYSAAGLEGYEDNWQLITERLKASRPNQSLVAED